MQQPAHFHSLTGARFIAAIAVLFYHFVPDTSTCRWIVKDGWLGVPFFFVLSGAVLAHSYVPKYFANKPLPMVDFLSRRFVRIYPTYLLSFALGFIPFLIAQSQSADSPIIAGLRTVAGSVLYLALLKSWLTTPWTSGVINSPAWSLSVEWFFYVLFLPLVWFLRVPLRRGGIFFVAAFTAILFLQAVIVAGELFLSHFLPTRIPHFWEDYFWRGPYAYLPIFAGGILLGGTLVRKPPGLFTLPQGLATWGGLFCLGIVLLAPMGVAEASFKRLLMLPVSCVLIAGLTRESTAISRFLAQPVLRILGEASYPLYILQMPLETLLAPVLPELSMLGAIFRLLIYSAISVVTVIAIERPGRHALLSYLVQQDANQESQ